MALPRGAIWVCLQFVFVVFPDHTHYFYDMLIYVNMLIYDIMLIHNISVGHSVEISAPVCISW